MRDVIDHYNKLIDEDNDPVRDHEPLRAYMDRWDGQEFIESMQLDKNTSVLEIGIGTGIFRWMTYGISSDNLTCNG